MKRTILSILLPFVVILLFSFTAFARAGQHHKDLSRKAHEYWGAGRYDKAIECYKQILAIQKELGSKEITRTLSNIGALYHAWCNSDETKCINAVEYYKKAGEKGSLNSIGQVYYSWSMHGDKSKLEKAVEYYKQALTTDSHEFNEVITSNIAEAYYELKNYKAAIEHFEKAVALKEPRRLSSTGYPDVALTTTYMLLASSYLRDDRPDMAFNIVERTSGRYLAEQLGKGKYSFDGIKKYQKKMKPQTVIINYAYIRNPLGYQFNGKTVEPIQMVVDNKNINGYEIPKYKTVASIKQYEPVVTSFLEKIRTLNVNSAIQPLDRRERRDDVIRPISDKGLHDLFKQTEFSMLDVGIGEVLYDLEFDAIVIYYRHLLRKPYLSKKEKHARDYISKKLYAFLFSQIEKHLVDKSELVIIPDGILAFLPFEALIMPDGRYLIEKYRVKYSPSLTMLEFIDQNKYPNDRKPLLAFGGAVYDKISYHTDMVRSERQFNLLQKKTHFASERGLSLRDVYSSLGYSNWSNLPGTLTEVESLKEITPAAHIFTGDEVSESRVKEMSKSGKLKQYKVLHFATHGLVVPEIPELSALVLSLFKQKREGEDGYLRLSEIVKLDLEADFINLSACETGIGKIYRGQGIAGLTQSFLIAGAKSIAVSLWQVSDESTMKFMTKMYSLVENSNMSYDRALTETKRKFITGIEDVNDNGKSRGLQVKAVKKETAGRYSNPFYWAPFLYYGK